MNEYKTQMQQDLDLVNSELDRILFLRQGEYDEVLEAMRYSVMNAGKRIRPVLTLEFCRMLGGRVEQALPFACAVEMIHCYSLIHDDLPCMDDDDLRRGKPSCHKAFGEATALLAGDGLLTLAFETAAKASLGAEQPEAVLRCVSCLASLAGVDGMVGGQVMDLAMERCPNVAEQSLRTMHAMKTGALIQAACQMGAIAAGGGQKAVEDAASFGLSLGLAFQTVDDILDVVSSVEELGKPVGSDAENQKVTFITLCGMEGAKALAARETERAMSVLEQYPDSGFLKQLTENLLIRRK